MGADIYLNSAYNTNKEKHEQAFHEAVEARNRYSPNCVLPEDETYIALQAEVSKHFDLMYSEGYFRDPYNKASMLNQLGLSWWRDVIPMLDEEGHLPIDKAKLLREDINGREFNISEIREEFADSQDTPDEWFAYFKERKAKLLALLDLSISIDEPLYCSL